MNIRTQTQKIKPKNTNSKLNPLNQLPFPLKIKSIMQWNLEENKDQCYKTPCWKRISFSCSSPKIHSQNYKIKENPEISNTLKPKNPKTQTKPSLFQTINNKERVWFSYLFEKPTQNQLKPTQNSIIWNPTINDLPIKNPTIWNSTQTIDLKPPNPPDPPPLIFTSVSLQGTQAKLFKLQSFVVDHNSHERQWVLSGLGLWVSHQRT